MKQIKKVKLHDDGKVDITYLEYTGNPDDNADPDVVTREGQHAAHPDLVQAFDALRIHQATICEQDHFTALEEKPDMLDIYKVNAATFAGDEPDEGAVLIGTRLLKGNKKLNLVSPFTKLNPDKTDYRYAESLSLALDTLLTEAAEYLNGKYAPSNQLNMFDELNDAIDQDEDSGNGKKKGKKKGKTVKLPKGHPLTQGMPEGTEVSLVVNE